LAITNLNVNTNLIKSFSDQDFQQGIGVSELGTLMYDNVILTLKEEGGVETTLTLNAVRFVVSQSKNIVKTQISGRNGTIKEYNNLSDYTVRCEAVLTTPNQRLFPSSQLNDFIKIAKSETEIDVVSRILNENFRIDSIIIEDYAVQPNTGASDVTINFTMISETPFDVKEFLIE